MTVYTRSSLARLKRKLPPRSAARRMSASASSSGTPISASVNNVVKWTTDNERVMIEYLIDNKAIAGDGLNFKDTVWNGVAAALEKQRTEGGVKTAKKCKEKWGQLRGIYNTVTTVKTKSGFPWSDTYGCNITLEQQSSWQDYVATNAAAKPYEKHTCFEHYSAMTQIMPQTVRGEQAFRPLQQTVGAVINRRAPRLPPPATDGIPPPLPSTGPAVPSTSAGTASSGLAGTAALAGTTSSASAGVTSSASVMPPPAPPAVVMQHGEETSLPSIQTQLEHEHVGLDSPHNYFGANALPIPPPASADGSSSQSPLMSTTAALSILKRKHSARGESVSLAGSGKRPRAAIGGPAALHAISQGVEAFNTQFGAFVNSTDQARRGRLDSPGPAAFNAQFGAFMNATDKARHDRQETSPERRQKAQDIVQEEYGYLSPEQVVLVCDVFETNTRAADTFLNYKKPEFRKAWIEMQLKRAGHPLLADGTGDDSL